MSYYFCQFQVILENILGFAFINGRVTRILSTCVCLREGFKDGYRSPENNGQYICLDVIDVEDCFWPSFGAER